MSGEQILDLGSGRFGLLAAPAGAGRRDVAVVLLSAGALHRTGPFRLHVALARALAALGYPVLRWDQPGIGDSIQAAERPQPEVAGGVLDRLQAATGCERFVVGGICSAADLGWRVALGDPRVVGWLSIDGYARADVWYWAARLRRLVGAPPAAWFAALRRRLGPQSARSPAAPAAPAMSQLRDWPAVGEARAGMARLVARATEVFALYTGGAYGYFLVPLQFRNSYGRASRNACVQLRYWPHCDHLFSVPQDREQLIDAIAEWLQWRLSGARGAAELQPGARAPTLAP